MVSVEMSEISIRQVLHVNRFCVKSLELKAVITTPDELVHLDNIRDDKFQKIEKSLQKARK